MAEKQENKAPNRIKEAWAEAREELNKTKAALDEQMAQIKKLSQSETYESDKIIEAVQKRTYEQKESFIKSLFDTKDYNEKKLALDAQYLKDSAAIESSNLTRSQKDQTHAVLKSSHQKQTAALDGGFYDKTAQELGDAFSDGLSALITDYDNFSDVMKKKALDLADYLVQTAAEGLMKQLFNQKRMEALSKTLGAGFSAIGGGIGAVGSFIGSLFKRHSGGVIPQGANMALPGTEEQLALLKGGERVLSPSENTSFENNASSRPPVVFVNNNVKAWDSKDVAKYLQENAGLINSIVADGIKRNTNHLRTMVQNV